MGISVPSIELLKKSTETMIFNKQFPRRAQIAIGNVDFLTAHLVLNRTIEREIMDRVEGEQNLGFFSNQLLNYPLSFTEIIFNHKTRKHSNRMHITRLR